MNANAIPDSLKNRDDRSKTVELFVKTNFDIECAIGDEGELVAIDLFLISRSLAPLQLTNDKNVNIPAINKVCLYDLKGDRFFIAYLAYSIRWDD